MYKRKINLADLLNNYKRTALLFCLDLNMYGHKVNFKAYFNFYCYFCMIKNCLIFIDNVKVLIFLQK